MCEYNFLEGFKNKKIALYGLGVETQRVLKALGHDFKILGLLDGFREKGEVYGYPVISLWDAMEHGVELIIAVARPGSCRAIARRIGEVCREKSITLLDIRGRNLLEDRKAVYDFSALSGMTKAELKRKAEEADAVSFDLFDTLVMRRTLFPEDVAEYVNSRLQEKGICIPDFCRRRLGSEKELSKNRAPALVEIYRHMLSGTDGNDRKEITAQQLAEFEWNIDFELLIPRKDVCDIFREMISEGKNTYIVSDSYYDREHLEQIVRKCGITEYAGILSSSDHGMSKSKGLYKALKNLESSVKILHIGDDPMADVECAARYGLATCRLYSGQDLLELTGNMGLSAYMGSLSGRLRIGMFVSAIFNSPFQFETDTGCMEIADVYDVGYLFCAPIISDFVFWFYGQMEKEHFQNIWLGARDGYLIQKMYAHLAASYGQTDRTVYFLTSRTAAIRAGVLDETDIRYVDDMKFSGTVEESLQERFGIDAHEVCEADRADKEAGLLCYKKPIMEKSITERSNYQNYMKGLDLREGNIAFFDFVAKGTSQMYIQRLVSNHMKGFYFLWLEAENMKDKKLDIRSFCEDGEFVSGAVYDNYYILETILTAPHPSVKGFDEDGQPVYADETRKDEDIRCFERVQEGILDYFKTYMELCPQGERQVDKGLDGILLRLIHEIKITDTDFLNLVIEDPFFHRMTEITDVL